MKPIKFKTLKSTSTALMLLAASSALPTSAVASTISGTVSFQGNVVFSAPIAGITETDMTASSGPGIDATGNGEHCTIVTNDSATVGVGGAYPDSGSLSVGIELSHGGMVVPDGTCLVQLRATGNDGGSVSARGTVTVEVTAAEIAGNATVLADDIVVRQSKTVAGLDKDCLKWTKKQNSLRNKCNVILWTKGGTEGSLKCKTAGDEPLGCDPGNYVESILALSNGQMDQQVNPPAALLIDRKVLADQAKCQRFLHKAAFGFVTKRTKLVQKKCIDLLVDSDACRAQQVADSRQKFTVIDNCVTAQGTDVLSGLTLADAGEPCRAECISAGTLDRKCMKTCLELELTTLSDGLIGDVPECGNGIMQGAEACDDGNLTNGDCCSSTCGNEAPGTQSCGVGECAVTVAQCSAGAPVTCTPDPAGTEASPAECSDLLDNDCDGFTDAADGSCPP